MSPKKRPFQWGKCYREPATISQRWRKTGLCRTQPVTPYWGKNELSRELTDLCLWLCCDVLKTRRVSHVTSFWPMRFMECIGGEKKQGQQLKDRVNFSAALKCLATKVLLERAATDKKHSWPQDTHFKVHLYGPRG